MMMTAFDNNNPAVWRLGPARYNVVRQLLSGKIFLKIAVEFNLVCHCCLLLTLIRMTKDEKGLAFFKGLLL
jgi:hypothetical protein